MDKVDKLDFVFYHIPKCGGSSIREFFKHAFVSKQFKNNEIYIACEDTNRPNIMDETKLAFYKTHFDKTRVLLAHINNTLYEKLDSKFNITCIRNPIHRAISSFNHFVLTDDPKANFEQLFKQSKIDTIVKNCYDCPIWLRTNLDDYNFIIVFENLEHDLAVVSDMLQVTNNIKVPHVDPAKKNKELNPNIFKLNLELPLHKHIYNAMKLILSKDIVIYNNICLMRKLNHLVI
jgi:hypothetical protein